MQAGARDRSALHVALGVLCFAVFLTFATPEMTRAAPVSDTITYVVRPGDRLADIAARYNVTVSSIVQANGLLTPDVIYPGQKLVIPGQASPGQPSVPSPTRDVYHTVQLGDTVDKIARIYGVSASAIVRANGISNADLIWVGQRLLIPGNASSATPVPYASPVPNTSPVPGATPAANATPLATPAPAATATPKPTAAPTIHVVQAGETLSGIAQRYGTTVAALVEANGLGDANLIRVGMRLLIVKGSGSAPVYSGQASRFEVSISQQRCWLYRGETVIAKWVCSTGRSGSGTRTGTFRIQSKMPKAYGSTWDIWMPYWLGIYWAGASENGIHGLPWNAKTGVQVWTGYVGTPITYGCVMLDNVNAKMLYDMAYIGMPVVIRW